MDTRQRLQRATRFFARPISFDLECPACGNVYQIRTSAGPQRRKDPMYDWTTSRFTCGECRRVYVIGLLAWPVSGGRRPIGNAAPRDQVPNIRQIAQLRKDGGGWWLPDTEKIGRPIPDETNLTTGDRRGSAEKYAGDVDEDQG